MLLKISLGLFSLIALFLIYVAIQPTDYTIVRETYINASPDRIYPYLNHSEKANSWMPWDDSDPELVMVYSGPTEGVGSKSSWDSPGKMGKGEALVIESEENKFVKTKLTYIRPMEMEQLATISLEPQKNGTIVRWQVQGKNNFIGKVFCIFMNMDEMVGKEFDKGLSTLKQMVED